MQDANGSEWRFRYDRTRNLVAKLDANAHLTTYRYDARNQRTEELQHLGNNQTLPARDSLPVYVAPNAGFTTGTLRTQWTYDGNGQLEDEVDAKGQTKHHEYGVLKRLSTVTYSGHVAPRVLPSIDAIGYTYRGEGEVETCSETKTTPAGAVTEVTRHFYDALERRTRTQRYDGYETTYGYDVKGNRTLVRDADGVETAYTYDAVDRLKTATTPVGVATYGYFEDGLLKQTDYGNGLREARTYDAAGRLLTLSVDKAAQAVSRFDYGYDANGNRVTQVETRGLSGETTTYGYDEADRLIGVEYPAETHLYQVDAVGNRTGEKRAASGVVAALTVAAFAALSPTVASAAVERQHNAVDWVTAVVDVKASTTTVLTYDANGNRTTEGTKAYAWDIRDTLTRVSDGASVLGTYDYDAKLQRVKADTGQGHVEYVLDGKYVLREAGARSRRYHFGEGEALAVTGVGGTAGQDRWLLTDALGSVVTEADATATSVTARQFDAWGNYRNNTAPTANETRLGYTGHQFDFETGLTYARARYYDSKLGLFLSRDPVGVFGRLQQPNELNAYAYASMNPLRYLDPDGRCSEDTQGAVSCVAEDAASAWAGVRSAWSWAFPDSDAPTAPDSPRPVEVAPNSGVALVDYDAPSRQRMRFQQQWSRSLQDPKGYGGMSVMQNADEAAALRTRRNVEGTLHGARVAADSTLVLVDEALKYEAPIALLRSTARVVVEAAAERAVATAPERLAAREASMKFEAEAAARLREATAQKYLPIFRDSEGQFQALIKSNEGSGPVRWTNVEPRPVVGEVHANSLEATGPHDVYVIRAQGKQTLPGGGFVEANQVLHFGETGRGFEVRGNEWIRKLEDEYGIASYVERLNTYEGKAAARAAETRRIDIYEGLFGKKPGFQDGSGNWVEIQKSRH